MSYDFLLWDLETVPREEKTEMPESFVKYGNTKLEDKRQAIKDKAQEDWDNNAESAVKFKSLNPEFGRIVSSAIIVVDSRGDVIKKDIRFFQRARLFVAEASDC